MENETNEAKKLNFAGSNSWLLGSHHLPAFTDQCRRPRSNPYLGIKQSHACQHLKIIISPKISTHGFINKFNLIMVRPWSPIHELSALPIIPLSNFDHLIDDNWCWTSPRGFWNRQQDGCHLWDRLQHLLLVIAIETLKLTKLNYFQSFLSLSGLDFLKSTYSLLNHYICHKSPRSYQERPQG